MFSWNPSPNFYWKSKLARPLGKSKRNKSLHLFLTQIQLWANFHYLGNLFHKIIKVRCRPTILTQEEDYSFLLTSFEIKYISFSVCVPMSRKRFKANSSQKPFEPGICTYHIGDQRRLRRACASAQSRQSLCCSHT